MIKAAIYCRLSDEDRNKANVYDESESIQNQKSLLVQYASDNEWEIYDIYIDDDYSGLDRDRPEFNRMLKDCENRKFNIVLCKSQSRFTRDMEMVEGILHGKFIEWGIRFISITDNADTLNKGNKKARQILGLTNEWYCEETSESVKAIFNKKRSDGKFIGSFATYGYEKDPKDRNKLIIDEPAARVIKIIFSLYLEGNGTQRIAQLLNKENIANPTKYKQQKGLNYKNSSQKCDLGLWNKTTVKRILKNEIYIGNMVQGKRKKLSYKSKKIVEIGKNDWIIKEDTHEAIIDKETFQDVQNRLNNGQRSTKEGKVHIFATKLKCMDCKSTMNKVTSANNFIYLRCKLYATGKTIRLCTSHSIRLEQLIDIVTRKLKTCICSMIDDNQIKSMLQAGGTINQKNKHIEGELININKKLKNISKAIESLYFDKVNGIITDEQFIEMNTSFLSQRESLMKNKLRCEAHLYSSIQNTEKQQEMLDGIINKYINLQSLTPQIVNKLIDYIEIGERDKKTKEQKIKIHWLF